MKAMTAARRAASRGILAVLIAASAAAAQQQPVPLPIHGEFPMKPDEDFLPEPPNIQVTPYATGLEVVWSLEFAPDGRLFIAERPGRIRIVSPSGDLDPTPWMTFNTVNELEEGLLGLALDPDFPNEPWVYAFHAVPSGQSCVNRVSRFREVNGRGDPSSGQVLIDGLPCFTTHNGGRIRFGPDGMLYITVGEIRQPMRAQDIDDVAGKVLRLTRDGRIPEDNPWPGNPAWAYGVRNPHGLAFRPSDGALFMSDNGPSGEWAGIGARDELVIIEKGLNYGWPLVIGAPGLEEYEDPLLVWNPALAPGDLVFYDGDLMPELRGDLFYSSLSGQALVRIRFQDPQQPDRVTAIERWFRAGVRGESMYGRLRGLAVGPDGALYVGTGNHDGRAPLREGDDRVLRIAPPGR